MKDLFQEVNSTNHYDSLSLEGQDSVISYLYKMRSLFWIVLFGILLQITASTRVLFVNPDTTLDDSILIVQVAGFIMAAFGMFAMFYITLFGKDAGLKGSLLNAFDLDIIHRRMPETNFFYFWTAKFYFIGQIIVDLITQHYASAIFQLVVLSLFGYLQLRDTSPGIGRIKYYFRNYFKILFLTPKYKDSGTGISWKL